MDAINTQLDRIRSAKTNLYQKLTNLGYVGLSKLARMVEAFEINTSNSIQVTVTGKTSIDISSAIDIGGMAGYAKMTSGSTITASEGTVLDFSNITNGSNICNNVKGDWENISTVYLNNATILQDAFRNTNITDNTEIIANQNALDVSYMFWNSSKITNTVNFQNYPNIKYASYMYGSCSSLNPTSYVRTPDNCTECTGLFSSCTNFNSEVYIGTNVAYPNAMFQGCTNLNSRVSFLGNSVISTAHMFADCEKFNQPVSIPNSVTNCAMMFSNSPNFNRPINIPNGVKDITSMFWRCYNFNQSVKIPNSVKNADSTFVRCYNLNPTTPFIFPNNITCLAYTIANCNSLNVPIVMGMHDAGKTGYINSKRFFTDNPNYNKPLYIGNSILTSEPESATFIDVGIPSDIYWDTPNYLNYEDQSHFFINNCMFFKNNTPGNMRDVNIHVKPGVLNNYVNTSIVENMFVFNRGSSDNMYHYTSAIDDGWQFVANSDFFGGTYYLNVKEDWNGYIPYY